MNSGDLELMQHPNRFNGAKFMPNRKRLLVRLDAVKSVSDGGIHIPGEAQVVPRWGTVAVKGEGVTIPVSGGDRVFFERSVGENLSLDGIEYLVVHEDDVLGVEVT